MVTDTEAGCDEEDTAPSHDEIFEDIDLALRMLQGARMASAHQQAQQGELEDAVKRAGEARGYRIARRMVNDYREEGELPAFTERGHWKAYAEMIDAFDKADEAVKEAMDEMDDDGPPPDPGAY